MYNTIVTGPHSGSSQDILLGGPEGGVLLLKPPAQIPGQMTLYDMMCSILRKMREKGPDTGFPIPQTGDYNQTSMTRDLNVAQAQFISETGLAPDISDRFNVFPVFPVLDYPVPPDLVSLTRIEYTLAGQQPYTMQGLSFQEWDNTWGLVQPTKPSGNPYYYRQPFAGYIRLLPQPTLGNFLGPGIGTFVLAGGFVAGQTVTATMVNPGFPAVTTLPYTVQTNDTPASIAFALNSAINVSAAVQGPTAFLQPPSVDQTNVIINAITAPGTSITYFATVTGVGGTVTPTTASPLSPNGDTMTFYYSSLGTYLIFNGDTPGIPPQFHMALVYKVLSDYWLQKQDLKMADEYLKRYEQMVAKGKSMTYDANREVQNTIAGTDYDSGVMGWGIG